MFVIATLASIVASQVSLCRPQAALAAPIELSRQDC